MMVTLLTLLGCPAEHIGTPEGTDTGVVESPPPDSDSPADSDTDTDTAPLEDRDGDGYGVGDDCDDDNPYVHPGADELCDARDQDCDGEPLALGVCGKVGYLTGAIVPLTRAPDEQWTLGIRIVQDLTGDGHPDVLGGPAYEFVDGDWLDAVWDGTALPTQADDYPAGAAALLIDPAGYQDSYARLSPGDLDGDGAPDAAFFDNAWPEVYVFKGPLAQDHRIPFTEADYIWVSGTAQRYGYPVVELGDLNGDGRADLGFGAQDSGDSSGKVRFDVVFGSTSAAGEFATVREGIDTYSFIPVGDVTGDGLPELLYWGARTALLDPTPIVPGSANTVEDLTLFDWDPGERSSDYVDHYNAGVTSDWDGDGYPEVYIGQGYNDVGAGYGAIFFFQAPFDEIATFDDASGAIAADEGTSGVGETVWQVTEPGTGAVRTLATRAGADGTIFFRDDLPVGVVTVADTEHLKFDAGLKSNVLLIGGHGEDVDRDGISDLTATDTDLFLVGYIPGFIPPWDDPTYW